LRLLRTANRKPSATQLAGASFGSHLEAARIDVLQPEAMSSSARLYFDFGIFRLAVAGRMAKALARMPQ